MATLQTQENKLYLSIKQYLCYDINWTYSFVMMAAFVQPLFDFCFIFANLNFCTILGWATPRVLALRIPSFLASSPGHSHFFNVARRKEGEPGRRNHVSAIAQWLRTQSIEPYPNRTDSTNGPISPFVSLCYCFRGVTRDVYSY